MKFSIQAHVLLAQLEQIYRGKSMGHLTPKPRQPRHTNNEPKSIGCDIILINIYIFVKECDRTQGGWENNSQAGLSN